MNCCWLSFLVLLCSLASFFSGNSGKISLKSWLDAICDVCCDVECESTVCYLCSWSPEENRTDYCSSANWQPHMNGYIDCLHGCESVTQFDKNGAVSIFYRNCANSDAPTYIQCQKIPGKAGSKRVCACNHRLCNRTSLTHANIQLLLLILSLVVLWNHHN